MTITITPNLDKDQQIAALCQSNDLLRLELAKAQLELFELTPDKATFDIRAMSEGKRADEIPMLREVISTLENKRLAQ